MKQVLLIEDDSFIIKNNKINVIVDNEKGLFLNWDPELKTCNLNLHINIKYLNKDEALNDIKWNLSWNLAKRGFILIAAETFTNVLSIVLASTGQQPNFIEYGEFLLVGEIVEQVRTVGVAKHHAEMYRRIVR